MANKLTPEETEELTGEDIKELRDTEHPGQEDEEVDAEGTGVDEPDLDSASWDDEVESEDKDDFTAAKIKFEELTDEDREIYLEMVSLRSEINEGSAEEEGAEDVNNLIKRCGEIKAELVDGSCSRFLDLMIKKLAELKV
ncbi:MAG: hypothetical protein V1661_01120 [bacterium]